MSTNRFPAHGTEAATARLARSAPRVPWDRFVKTRFNPKPGEHIAIVGPTGQGKTTVQNAILPMFPFVTVFASKPQDETMEQLIVDGGYERLARWHKMNPIDHPRRVVWPDAMRVDSRKLQYEVFSDAFEKIFREAGRPRHAPVGWALAIDELWYVVNMLRPPSREMTSMMDFVKMFLLQGRSLGHSLIIATQRPVAVPLEVYDQSTHLFFFRDNDDANLDRLSGINARDSALVRYAVSNLEEYQMLYINTRTGEMVRTRAPVPRLIHRPSLSSVPSPVPSPVGPQSMLGG